MMFPPIFSKYSRVSLQSTESCDDSQCSDEEKLISEEESELKTQDRVKRLFDRRDFCIGAVFGSLFSGAFISILLVIQWKTQLDRLCLNRHAYFSPALPDINPEYRVVRFNGTLDYPSEYRGPPSPEIDRAWQRLEDVRVMSISEEELIKSGFNTDSVRLPEQLGGGYMASVEINHQLHCLNFLRKALHRDYYEFKTLEFTDHPHMVQIHLNHCIEMLRQSLMCHADVGVMAHRWVEHYPNPYPDFNVIHKCRNFEEVLQWTYDQQIPHYPDGYVLKPQDGEKIWDSPP